MNSITKQINEEHPESRRKFIVESFTNNYEALISGDPGAWRGKFRKMAESAFAFYRGSAALFYADVSRDEDPFLNEQTSRVWIQGDLHAENFGTYMNGAGVLVFDVNDFDESYVGPFTWDMKRFCASLGLIGYQKAMSDQEISDLIAHAARSYARQIARFAAGEDQDFSLRLDTAQGVVLSILQKARLLTRVALLDSDTEIRDGDRRFRIGKYNTALDEAERMKILATLKEYFKTIPTKKRRASMVYEMKDVVRRRGAGIGSAGLQMYSVLLEGETQALENDLLISLKLAQPSAVSPHIPDKNIKDYFKHDGHRTTISQRALQAYADPLLGYASFDGKGVFAAEVSPYTADLNWGDINDFDDMLEVVEELARCVAKIHCVSDEDSDQTLLNYSTEHAINGVLDGREADFVAYLTHFGVNYSACVRRDYLLFVDAFRNKEFPHV